VSTYFPGKKTNILITFFVLLIFLHLWCRLQVIRVTGYFV